ncbi:MAG: hypothetical protein ABH952_00450 [Candidatus Omnitrophota bacterium]
MFEIFVMIAWILGLILGIMWLFLPWMIIAKLNEVITELKNINSKISK